MDQKLDIATAFDISLDDATEHKFQALKNLHAKKIKLLMASVDSSQKEVAKLKALNKDNMRTQMIQALRKKIRDIELVVDVLKQELKNKAEMTGEEVNEYIMRKTLGGPKRFRPLTREELETKISELEKKYEMTEKKLAKRVASDTNATAVTGAVNSKKSGASALGSGVNANTNATVAAADLSRFAQNEVQLDELQNTVAVKNNLLAQYKEELVRLRARNNELLCSEEECEIVEILNDELKQELKTAREEVDALNRQMISYHEEFIQQRNDSNMETELKFIDNESLQEQCNKLLQYNSSLLKRMAELEGDLEQAQANSSNYGSGGSGNENSRSSALEAKVAKLQIKLKSTEEKLRQSEHGNNSGGDGHGGSSAEVKVLKDTLREKNETIRDLTKQLAHAHAGTGSGGKGSASGSSGSARASPSGKQENKDKEHARELEQQVVDLQRQLKASLAENKTLRQNNTELSEQVEDLKAELAMFDDAGAHNSDDDGEGNQEGNGDANSSSSRKGSGHSDRIDVIRKQEKEDDEDEDEMSLDGLGKSSRYERHGHGNGNDDAQEEGKDGGRD